MLIKITQIKYGLGLHFNQKKTQINIHNELKR